MIKQYFKQALYLLRGNKLLSFISILGTALAIAMIMCLVLIYQAHTANYEPETHRDRLLSVGSVIGRKINDDGWNNSRKISLRVVKECFYPLTSAEEVTAVSSAQIRLAGTPGGTEEVKCNVSFTDDAFWRVFDFRFLSGKPYGKEFLSGEKKAVISRTLARRVFSTDEVVGRTLSLSFVDYTICGVVADVSVLADKAYAEVWLPYTTLEGYAIGHCDGLLGSFNCYLLASDVSGLETLRHEAQRNVDRMNAAQKEFKLVLSGAPDTQLMSMARNSLFTEPPVTQFILIYVVLIIILLLVPAINLSGITLSRMRRRMEEVGLRRAFGASRGELLVQVLTENFLLTLIGGVVGLLLSYLSVLWLREWLLNTSLSGYYGIDTAVSAGMVLSPSVFGLALLFCLLMNLLSAGIPAWRVSRIQIVSAIK